MLDDIDYIARFDPQNALGIAAGQTEQLLHQSKPDTSGLKDVQNVVLAGMGGSALAGLLCRSWWDEQLKIPLVITRGYDLPAFVGPNTLVIASSYSGNTEETLSALKNAEAKKAQIVILTSGGRLKAAATKKDYPLLLMPEAYQPRLAVWFAISLLTELFEGLGLIKGAGKQLEVASKFLMDSVQHYVPQVKTEDNLAKQIATKLSGKSIIVYGGDALAAAAYKWKINFNENAKNLAWAGELPEFNHNEFMGWTSNPVQKPFAVVELQSEYDSPRVAKRFEISNRLLSGKMPKAVEVEAEGKNRIEQILWIVLLGDFVSIYLAILNGVNPTPVDLIEKLKRELA